jgi:quinohemoprotein ethanol dehydrogenase
MTQQMAVLTTLALMTVAYAAKPATAPVDDARLRAAPSDPSNWLTYGGSWLEQRYSSLDQINARNAGQLGPAWSFDLDTDRGQESTPLVADGTLYVTTAWSKVYALDAKTGKQRWFFDPQVPGTAGPKPCCDVVNRGAALYEGKVFVGTLDGRLIALDAVSGRVVWSVLTVDPKKMYSITGAPRVARGKVYIGNGGGEFGGRGYVSAYDAKTGKLVWRFYTIPSDPAKPPDGAASDEVLDRVARPTWFGPWTGYRGGGQVWNAIVYDPDFNQLYIATGNGFPHNNKYRSDGKGDNLFIASIVALNADTGHYVWHLQETPGDSWDYDSVQDMILADLTLDGRERKVLLHAPKNGFFYVLDRKTGKLASVAPYVPDINWAKSVDPVSGRPDIEPGAHYADAPFNGHPGEGGAHGWQPFAFSPKTGLVYFPAAESSTYFVGAPTYDYVDGLDNPGFIHGALPAAHGAGPGGKSYLLAWNPVTQKAAWRADVARGGGVLVTAGDLVFQGRGRSGVLGELAAFRADTGEEIWKYKTPNAILQGPVTYTVDGEQYVAAASGAGGASIIMGGEPAHARQVGRIVAFKLGGTASFPSEPELAPRPAPPSLQASAAVIEQGKLQYARLCGRCHGLNMFSANIVPDLRRSAALADGEAWKAIVLGGALESQGMVSWARFLTPQGAESIRAYVADEARKLSAQ